MADFDRLRGIAERTEVLSMIRTDARIPGTGESEGHDYRFRRR